MKTVNLLSVLDAKQRLTEENFKAYLSYIGTEIRNSELDDLRAFVESLIAEDCHIGHLDGFFLGYKIPQIGKEFDLLRFEDDYILNVELKRKSSLSDMQKQLKLNQYYLKFLDLKVFSFVFEAETRTLYTLSTSGDLIKSELSSLVDLFKNSNNSYVDSIDELFNPADYLVSPFNSTERFLSCEYFLTNHQEQICTEISKSISEGGKFNFIALQGGAGTGKTLLGYALVKRLQAAGRKCLIVHCGQLNQGHRALQGCGWSIASIKEFSSYDPKAKAGFDFILIDEAQRIYPHQFEEIVSTVKENKLTCVFSFDEKQTLAIHEAGNDIPGKIMKLENLQKYKLKDKIRSNKEIADFINLLFSKKSNKKMVSANNVSISYFAEETKVDPYLSTFRSQGWEVLRFTASQYDNEYHERFSSPCDSNSHTVIGQEFDKVVIVLDRFFDYNDAGDIVYRSKSYYDAVKMLFQNMTRCRRRLHLVFVQNQVLLARCSEVLKTG